MKRSVAVTIAGQRISLKSDADESYVQLLAECVDGRMRDLQKRSQKAGLQEVALLAALQLADDLLREQQRRAELRRRVRGQVNRLLAGLPVAAAPASTSSGSTTGSPTASTAQTAGRARPEPGPQQPSR